jgi:Fe-S-cluster containining protein
MPKNTPIRILDDRKVKGRPADNSKIVGLTLDIFGRRLEFCITAAGNARLGDIIPAARVICDKITDVTIEQIRAQGQIIPCRKACAACCNYLVSLSVPEAFCFKQEIFHKKKYQLNRTLQPYFHAARRIVKYRPPDHLLESPSNSSVNFYGPKILAAWYAGLNITCAFLRNSQCTIYEQRPFVCREHLVTGSEYGCRGKSSKTQIIEMPVQMGNVLCLLSKELCDAGDAVMMPLALAWCDVNKHLCERTWPAEVITKLFIKIIKETVSAPGHS